MTHSKNKLWLLELMKYLINRKTTRTIITLEVDRWNSSSWRSMKHFTYLFMFVTAVQTEEWRMSISQSECLRGLSFWNYHRSQILWFKNYNQCGEYGRSRDPAPITDNLLSRSKSHLCTLYTRMWFFLLFHLWLSSSVRNS